MLAEPAAAALTGGLVGPETLVVVSLAVAFAVVVSAVAVAVEVLAVEQAKGGVLVARAAMCYVAALMEVALMVVVAVKAAKEAQQALRGLRSSERW